MEVLATGERCDIIRQRLVQCQDDIGMNLQSWDGEGEGSYVGKASLHLASAILNTYDLALGKDKIAPILYDELDEESEELTDLNDQNVASLTKAFHLFLGCLHDGVFSMRERSRQMARLTREERATRAAPTAKKNNLKRSSTRNNNVSPPSPPSTAVALLTETKPLHIEQFDGSTTTKSDDFIDSRLPKEEQNEDFDEDSQEGERTNGHDLSMLFQHDSFLGEGTSGDSPGGSERTRSGTAKSWWCEICSKGFTRKDMLGRHMRQHNGLKPFSCQYCGLAFSRRDHVAAHERTHTGEKPFSCEYCEYTSCRSDTIARHMVRHRRRILAGEEEVPAAMLEQGAKTIEEILQGLAKAEKEDKEHGDEGPPSKMARDDDD